MDLPGEISDIMQMSTADIDRHFRELAEQQTETDLRISWLANHTVDPLLRATTVLSAGYGVSVDGVAAPYDQHFQELLNEGSATRQSQPDVIVLSLSLRRLAPTLVNGTGKLNADLVDSEIERVVSTIGEWLNLALTNTQSHLFICNFIRPAAMRFSVADQSLSLGEHAVFATLNQRLAALTAESWQPPAVTPTPPARRPGTPLNRDDYMAKSKCGLQRR